MVRMERYIQYIYMYTYVQGVGGRKKEKEKVGRRD